MGAAELQTRLGYPRQRRECLADQPQGFPEPAEELTMSWIWLASDVEDWITQQQADLAEKSESE
jgi:hypothetical protein